MTKIFISWSGETSHKIALLLRDWLPALVENAETWVSSEDILKGERWGVELSRQLAETSFGIICLDPTNIQSPWLNFEAGALSKSIEHGKVFPLLYNIPPNDFKGPLSQFQVTTFEKDDLLKLVRSLNQNIGTSKIPPERLHKTFEIVYPGLINAIQQLKITAIPEKKASPKSTTPLTSDKESGISPLELKVLQLLSLHNYLDTASILKEIEIPNRVAGYYINNLKEKGLIGVYSSSNSTWYITKEGVGVLVENNLA